MPDSVLFNATFLFRLREDGHIVCLEHFADTTVTWCSHLEHAMRNRGDSGGIFGKTDLTIAFDLMIPMFPSADLWTQVELQVTNPIGDQKRWRVMWFDCPTIPNNQDGSAKPGMYVCTLNPGEGRNVIREALVEVMYGDSKRTVFCKSAHHGFDAQDEWLTFIRNGKGIIQDWSVYTTGWCLWCTKRFNELMNEASTVPEQQGGVWNK